MVAQSRRSDRLFSSRPNCQIGTPHPLTRRRVCLTPLWFGWRDTLTCGRGGRGVPIPTRGQTLWYSRFVCTLWMAVSAHVCQQAYSNTLCSPQFKSVYK